MTTPTALTSAVVSTFDLLTPYLATYVTTQGQPELTHLLTQVTASRATELISVYLRRALTLVFDANPNLWLSATRLKINASEAATLDHAALLQWVREREPQMIAESPLDDLVKKLMSSCVTTRSTKNRPRCCATSGRNATCTSTTVAWPTTTSSATRTIS